MDLGSRIIEVNRAGEHGEFRIYTGQIVMARLTAPALVEEQIEFRSHERRHREIFRAKLARRGARRCRSRSYWLCGIGGWVLGIVTGLMGAGAISATTVAVEQVVLRHLEHQPAQLRHSDPNAVTAITAIIEYEQQHHDRSAALVRAGSFWPRLLTPAVAASTEAVIWVGMRA